MGRVRVVLLVAAGFALFMAGAWVGLVSGGAEQRSDRASVEEYVTEDFGFSYPSGWERVAGVEFPLAEEQGTDQVGRDTVGFDRDSWVSVFASDVPVGFRVTPQNVDGLLAVQREVLSDQVAGTDGELVEAPRRVDAAGLVGFRARVAGPNVRGVMIESTLTQLFDGDRSYVIACQSEALRAAQIARGCAMVLDSFEPRAGGAELAG